MIIDVEKVLKDMVKSGRICGTSVPHIISRYGAQRKVDRRVLETAMDDRGLTHFRRFFATAFDWPSSLTNHLEQLEHRILWGRKYRRLEFFARRRLVEKSYIAAVLAYAKEISKP